MIAEIEVGVVREFGSFIYRMRIAVMRVRFVLGVGTRTWIVPKIAVVGVGGGVSVNNSGRGIFRCHVSQRGGYSGGIEASDQEDCKKGVSACKHLKKL